MFIIIDQAVYSHKTKCISTIKNLSSSVVYNVTSPTQGRTISSVCVIQGNIHLSFVLIGWGLGFKQIRGLFVYTYNFHFLCYAHNLFLHEDLAGIVNFYQQTDRRTDQQTN